MGPWTCPWPRPLEGCAATVPGEPGPSPGSDRCGTLQGAGRRAPVGLWEGHLQRQPGPDQRPRPSSGRAALCRRQQQLRRVVGPCPPAGSTSRLWTGCSPDGWGRRQLAWDQRRVSGATSRAAGAVCTRDPSLVWGAVLTSRAVSRRACGLHPCPLDGWSGTGVALAAGGDPGGGPGQACCAVPWPLLLGGSPELVVRCQPHPQRLPWPGGHQCQCCPLNLPQRRPPSPSTRAVLGRAHAPWAPVRQWPADGRCAGDCPSRPQVSEARVRC